MTYPGGKNGSGVYQTIINQMPPHRAYIEAFLGMGAVMRAKRPASCSIGIDSDEHVLVGWRQYSIPGLSLVCDDALRHLSTQHFSPDCLIYLDPPYLMSTRSSQRALYRHEFGGEDDHRALLDIIKGLPCMVMISGYYSDLYAQELAGWRPIHFQAMTRSGKMATEWLWMNFPEPWELHDYNYLGKDFRERERIKRKQLRWRNRLSKMPALERYAMLMTINDIASARTAMGTSVE